MSVYGWCKYSDDEIVGTHPGHSIDDKVVEFKRCPEERSEYLTSLHQ